MKFKYLEYILEIEKNGSLNQAAKNMYISPQNMSRTLQLIETELNTTLFIRSPLGMATTKEGEIFIDFCKKSLTDYYQTLGELKNNHLKDSALSGDICLCSTPYISKLFLNDFLFKFKIRYPQINLTVITSDALDGYSKLDTEKYNFGLFPVFEKIKNYDITCCQPLLNLSLKLCVSTQHPLSSLERITIDQIIEDKIRIIATATSHFEYSDVYTIFGEEIIDQLDIDIYSDEELFERSLQSCTHAGLICENIWDSKTLREKKLKIIDIEDERINTEFPLALMLPGKADELNPCEKLFTKHLEQFIDEAPYLSEWLIQKDDTP